MKFVYTLMLLSCCFSGRAGEEGKFIGTRPPEWVVADWINSPPLTLEKLQGKVVLVRWWTAPHCHYCAATAPALNEFAQKFESQGLVVIGFYHHKSDEPLRVEEVKSHVKRFGFTFPVAIDRDWTTLEKWWLNQIDRKWTSVSFLLDRNGSIRYIHPGGEYPIGSKDYRVLEKHIQQLLGQK